MKDSEVYGVYLKFNPKTEKELIEKLERVKKKNTYIKDLIRDDIKLELLIKKRSLLQEGNE